MQQTSYFSNFFAADVNKKAKTAAIEFARNTADKSVLVISGQCGNGSTHLAFAIVNAIRKNTPEQRIFSTTFENVQYGLKSKQSQEKLRTSFLNSHSVVLIDSYTDKIWEAASKELLTRLQDVRTKVIITCAEDVSVDLQHRHIRLFPPSDKEKVQIIKDVLKKLVLKDEKIAFSNSAILYLSSADFGSVRHLQGLIISLLARRHLNNYEIDLHFVKKEYLRFKNRYC
ncbi:MAG TPA: DnaA/Hda family protein [Bacteroidia bacterium]|nr:DnaA/Hda family protein [Bacteroidia bacterium]